MKEKYVDEKFGYWYEFGDGDIASSCSSLNVTCNHTGLPWIVEEHNRVQSKLVKTALAFSEASPEEFKKFWYGDV